MKSLSDISLVPSGSASVELNALSNASAIGLPEAFGELVAGSGGGGAMVVGGGGGRGIGTLAPGYPSNFTRFASGSVDCETDGPVDELAGKLGLG